ncbi:putative F-box/LRR-repeat protein At5g02700 [Malus domestica]|uniref:putative F-box/LRR-repeat protein At5g02700 n=1 Tax=Malus domestica TaxID=3750 RepID=UPI0010A9BE8F|nr:putative F-box/LRR-repeat protein At5g02700 [Malus domestica]
MMNSKGGECNLVDRISKLPEEILVTIVSLLPLKEAGATSILSKRWQYVWASTVTLDFDPKHELGEHYCRLLRVEPEQKDLLRQRYVDWVNTVVEQHRGPVIEQFRAYFDIDGHFTSSIDKWIQFAMNKRVQILELVFCNELRSNYKDVYPFPVQLLGLQNDSTLKLNPTHSDISSLHSSRYNVGFKFLRVLYFNYVDVSGKVLEYLLSNCPVLERLKVDSANNKLVNLRVVGSSMALKYLDIQFCFALRSIEIRDANLVSFMYVGGRHINLLLSNVPLLVEVCVNERIKPFLFEGRIYYRSIQLPFTQLSCCLSQLEVLMLPIDGAVSICNYNLLVFFSSVFVM